MATVMDYLDRFLPQEFSRTVYDTVRAIDPVFLKVRETFDGVSADEISNDWRVQHTYTTSVAGAYRYRAALGHTTAGFPASGTAVAALGQGTVNTFVSFQDSVHPGDVQRAIQLIQADGTMSIPHQVLRADGLSAMIGRKVARLMRGMARNIAQTEANSFYSPTSGTLVADLGDVSVNFAEGAGATAILTLDTTLLTAAQFDSRMARFVPGQAVDFFDITAGVLGNKRNTVPWVVTLADYIDTKTIVFEPIDGTETLNVDTTLVDNDAIVPAGFSGTTGASTSPITAESLPFGYRDWVRNSGTLFDTAQLAGGTSALNLALYPWFKSLISAEGTVFLSEALLNKRFAAFWDAYGGLYKCSHGIVSAGVLNGYLAGIDSQIVYDRGVGGTLQLKEGFVGLDYQYMGRPITIMVSPSIATGEFLALDLEDGNIVRYVAPPLPGSGADNTVGRVEFVAPAFGYKGIWAWASTVASNTVRRTDFAEAPFLRLYNIAPERIPSIRLTGLQESI